MKRILYLSLALTALLFASCTTVRKTASTSDIRTEVMQYPTVADLDVLPKVEQTITWNFVPFHWGQPPLDVRKTNLQAEVIKAAGADVLLESQFVFTKRSFGERTLTVTGYPAKFKNFRKATPEDIEALSKVLPAQQQKVYKVSRPWYKFWKR